ncbi:MAG: putative beta-lysine N-acetyltransferase [Desulfobulbaceae bacterium]|nr:putative beta-lysine N-acetyltransferase [Desulfobulbaceae bacterium]
MPDQMLNIGASTLQHGHDSSRVYLMELADADMPGLLPKVNVLAKQQGYGKIFAKVPGHWVSDFTNDGFATEAMVPGFYMGNENGHFMGKYLTPDRAHDPHGEEINKILSVARETGVRRAPDPIEPYTARVCTADDCQEMAACYRSIFPSYPFPVHDPAFLAATMAEHVTYFGIWHGKELAALASAEQYQRSGHVEMTDFLTMPAHRRQGLAGTLLATMDRELTRHGITMAYTIARALSFGMNITFARAGYRHGGTLINNTQICGRIESMQVWYKQLL